MKASKKKKLWHLVIFAVCCIALNLIGKTLSYSMSFPFYFDTLGTIFAGAIGGYLPAIIVGYVSNMLSGISDQVSFYYASISALIGVVTAFFAGRGFWRKWFRPFASLPVIVAIGGGLGSLLTWCLNDFSPYYDQVFVSGFISKGFSPFWAQFTSDIIIDLADKVVVILFAMVIIMLLPVDFKALFDYEGWKQRPLTVEEKRIVKQRNRHSLRRKQLLLFTVVALLVAVAFGVVCGILYHRNYINREALVAENVTRLVTKKIDGDKVSEYIEKEGDVAGYQEIEAELYEIRDSFEDIEYLYVYRILEDGCHVVFDLDTEEVEASQPGDLIEFDESFAELIPKLLAGESIDPIVTNDTFGWLLTVYTPVYDSKGNCSCYAAVDMQMSDLRVNEIAFIAKEVAIFLGLFLLIIFAGLWITDYSIVLPVNSITMAANNFAYENENARRESVGKFHSLDIRTGDEIENLYHVVDKTMTDQVNYMEEIQARGEQINMIQNGLILILADIVESRDKCTGDHVKKTAAYARMIMEHMRKLGIYEGRITDEFLTDVVNSAPLHDIGKIHVSDVILNKPGKLTDEEYGQMKLHTTAGSEIIDRAIETVGGENNSGYLKEARNLAEYHHERWDGKGYPNGLAGEEIPLSARIMAVADVFDALVSKRSYKEPFSFEEAMSIIREGSGTQFDPEVVRAFEDASDEARYIAEKFLNTPMH